MTTVVLNGGDLEAEILDATGEGLAVDTAVIAEAAEIKGEGEVKTSQADTDLDKEGEDGLTEREKQDLSAKMLKAVGKRVREKREAEEFAAEQYNLRLAAEKRLKELEGVQPAKTEAPAVKGPPARADFTTDEEYIAALVNHGVESRLAEKQAEDAKKLAEQRQADIITNANAMIAKAIKLVPDYEDVVSAVDEVVPPDVVRYMQESDMFAELGYYLGEHSEFIVELQKMRPDKQLVAIGKIEGKLVPFSERLSEKTNATTASKSSKSQPLKAEQDSQTGSLPSAARKPAPVITPISAQGNSGDVSLENVRDHIADFARTRGVNLSRRQRH